jgi:hypothetical protein
MANTRQRGLPQEHAMKMLSSLLMVFIASLALIYAHPNHEIQKRPSYSHT